MQTALSAMRVITAKAKTEEEKLASESAAEQKVSFHQKERNRSADDPQNEALQSAITHGIAKAKGFLATLHYPAHPDHEKNLALYKNVYGMDNGKLEAAMVEAACKEKKAAPFEITDPAYEQLVKNKYRPRENMTLEQLKFYENFVSALEKKHFEVGYSGDKKFTQEYAEKYGLKSQTTFEPKD